MFQNGCPLLVYRNGLKFGCECDESRQKYIDTVTPLSLVGMVPCIIILDNMIKNKKKCLPLNVKFRLQNIFKKKLKAKPYGLKRNIFRFIYL